MHTMEWHQMWRMDGWQALMCWLISLNCPVNWWSIGSVKNKSWRNLPSTLRRTNLFRTSCSKNSRRAKPLIKDSTTLNTWRVLCWICPCTRLKITAILIWLSLRRRNWNAWVCPRGLSCVIVRHTFCTCLLPTIMRRGITSTCGLVSSCCVEHDWSMRLSAIYSHC